MKFWLDAKGTPGTDPAKIDRVYADGVRIPLSEPERDDAVTQEQAEIRAGLAKLREYIALASPTNAQSVAVLRILCRGMALVVKHLMEIEEAT